MHPLSGLAVTWLAAAVLVVLPNGTSATEIELRPIRASGVQGEDWELGPGGNEITLLRANQFVEIEIYLGGFSPAIIAVHQTAVDCAVVEESLGTITAVSTVCPHDGEFGVDFCLGVDDSRGDYLLANSSLPLAACQSVTECPSGDPGHFACGSVALVGDSGPDAGTPYYVNHVAFHVAGDATGSHVITPDPNPLWTFLVDPQTEDIPIDNVIPAIMTIEECQQDDACDDGSACTQDSCARGTCMFESLVAEGFCCDPMTGAQALIDDDNHCTVDTCMEDGTVSHRVAGPCSCLLDDDCDDNSVCTVDSCVDLLCEFRSDVADEFCCDPVSGDLVVITDEDACTLDTCRQDGSVDHELIDACVSCTGDGSCDDGLNCTENDTCVEGVCSGEAPFGFCCDEEADGLVEFLIIDSEPQHLAVDARQPHSPVNPQSTNGWRGLTLAVTCDPSGLSTADFEVSVESGDAPEIRQLHFVEGGGGVQVEFVERIPAGQWTTLTFLISGQQICVGSLPGDVNGDRVTGSSDILALIDSLNGVRPLPEHATDIDRNNELNSQDILRLIDLLNGALSYSPWIDATLGNCP